METELDRQQNQEREEQKKFNKWREKVNKRLPEVAKRVFALRGKHYSGCGFHYELEKQLGMVIRDMNNHIMMWDSFHRINCKVNTNEFFRNLSRSEKSANLYEKQNQLPKTKGE